MAQATRAHGTIRTFDRPRKNFSLCEIGSESPGERLVMFPRISSNGLQPNG